MPLERRQITSNQVDAAIEISPFFSSLRNSDGCPQYPWYGDNFAGRK